MLPDNYLTILKSEYPKRKGDNGWGAVPRIIKARLAEGHTWETILEGVKRYRRFCLAEGMWGTGFIKQARTFLGPDLWFLEDYDVDIGTPVQTLDERASEYGMSRFPQESDEKLERRIADFLTARQYGKNVQPWRRNQA